MNNLSNTLSENELEAEVEKEKVTDLELIFEVFDGRPYYSIKYKNVGEDDYNIGYSSYNFEIVLQFKEKYFELVEEEKSSTEIKHRIDRKIISDSIQHYGVENQSTVCMEECSELIQAISKAKRGKINKENLKEEIADVLICIEMLKQMYAIPSSDIDRWIGQKQARELERMGANELS